MVINNSNNNNNDLSDGDVTTKWKNNASTNNNADFRRTLVFRGIDRSAATRCSTLSYGSLIVDRGAYSRPCIPGSICIYVSGIYGSIASKVALCYSSKY